MILYKVLKQLNKRLYSAVVSGGPAKIRYLTNRINKPHPSLLEYGLGILAFKYLEDAQHFLSEENKSKKLVIYEAETTETFLDLPPGFCIWEFDSINGIIKQCKKPYGHGFPSGTINCKNLKLLKRIKI